MPVVDGFDTASQIRAQPWGQPVLICAVTGFDRLEHARRSYESGIDRTRRVARRSGAHAGAVARVVERGFSAYPVLAIDARALHDTACSSGTDRINADRCAVLGQWSIWRVSSTPSAPVRNPARRCSNNSPRSVLLKKQVLAQPAFELGEPLAWRLRRVGEPDRHSRARERGVTCRVAMRQPRCRGVCWTIPRFGVASSVGTAERKVSIDRSRTSYPGAWNICGTGECDSGNDGAMGLGSVHSLNDPPLPGVDDGRRPCRGPR